MAYDGRHPQRWDKAFMEQLNSSLSNDQVKRRFKPSKKQLLVVVYAVLILAVPASLGFLAKWFVDRSSNHGKQTVSGLPTAVDEVQNLRLKGKDAEANKKIDEALNDPKTSDSVKQQLYIQKGYVAIQAGDYQAAVDAYTKAIATKPNPDLYRMLGELYFQQGKKADARAAYVKGLDLLKSSKESYGGLENDLRQRIDIIDGKIKPE